MLSFDEKGQSATVRHLDSHQRSDRHGIVAFALVAYACYTCGTFSLTRRSAARCYCRASALQPRQTPAISAQAEATVSRLPSSSSPADSRSLWIARTLSNMPVDPILILLDASELKEGFRPRRGSCAREDYSADFPSSPGYGPQTEALFSFSPYQAASFSRASTATWLTQCTPKYTTPSMLWRHSRCRHSTHTTESKTRRARA